MVKKDVMMEVLSYTNMSLDGLVSDIRWCSDDLILHIDPSEKYLGEALSDLAHRGDSTKWDRMVDKTLRVSKEVSRLSEGQVQVISITNVYSKDKQSLLAVTNGEVFYNVKNFMNIK